MKQKSFTFRSSWLEAMRNMSGEIRLSLMDAICRYAFYGEQPAGLDPVAEVAFILIRAEIDSSPSRRKADAGADTAAHDSATPDNVESVTRENLPDGNAREAFDRSYDAVASRVKGKPEWRDMVYARTGVLDMDMAVADFREYLLKNGSVADFVGTEMREKVFCNKLIAYLSRPDAAICHINDDR